MTKRQQIGEEEGYLIVGGDAASASAEKISTFCAIEFENVAFVEMAGEGFVHQNHESDTEAYSDCQEQPGILPGGVLDERVINDRIEDKRNRGAKVKVQSIEQGKVSAGKKLLRLKEQGKVASDKQIVTKKQKERQRDDRHTMNNCVHRMYRANAVRSTPENGRRDQHPSGIELENDGYEEVHQKHGSEQNGEQPYGCNVEKGVVAQHKRQKQNHIKGGLECVIPIGKSVAVDSLFEQERGGDNESIHAQHCQEHFHGLTEACSLGNEPLVDSVFVGSFVDGEDILVSCAIEEHKKKAGRKRKNRNGKRRPLYGGLSSQPTSSPKSLITVHCIYADCMEPTFQVFGYKRYTKRYLEKHCMVAHGAHHCFVCQYCGMMFCELLHYEDHAFTRCLNNPKVVRRMVVKRSAEYQHQPYVRLTAEERLELLEKELLQFPKMQH